MEYTLERLIKINKRMENAIMTGDGLLGMDGTILSHHYNEVSVMCIPVSEVDMCNVKNEICSNFKKLVKISQQKIKKIEERYLVKTEK